MHYFKMSKYLSLANSIYLPKSVIKTGSFHEMKILLLENIHTITSGECVMSRILPIQPVFTAPCFTFYVHFLNNFM